MGLSRVAQPSNTIHVVMARANVCRRVGGRRVSTELRNETSTPPSSPAPEVVHKGGYHYFIHAPAPTLLGPSVVSEYLPQTHTTKALTNTHTHTCKLCTRTKCTDNAQIAVILILHLTTFT